MFHLYDVDTDDGPVKMIAVLPPEAARESGLPSPAVAGTVPLDAPAITLENFTENAEFSDFVNFVISKHGETDPALAAQAEAQGDGWIYMVDLRIVEDEAAEGDVSAVDTEDILGAFRVQGGKVVPGSYRGNPNHRVLTERGLMQVDGWVHERLVEELQRLG
jgi:hypothetical protein